MADEVRKCLSCQYRLSEYAPGETLCGACVDEAATNKEGLTFMAWLAAAGKDEGSAELWKAWEAGEDPTERRAGPFEKPCRTCSKVTDIGRNCWWCGNFN